MKKAVSTIIPGVLLTFVAFALILAQAAPLKAQKSRPIGPPPNQPPADQKPAKPVPNARSVEQATLEMSVLLANRSRAGDVQRERQRIAAQLTRDLERLGEINALKIIPLTSAKSLDYKSLAQATAEIRERALRIKFSVSPALKDSKDGRIQYDEDVDKLGIMLPELSRLVTAFLGSPIFRFAAPNDTELRRAASSDLQGIIRLSQSINKIAKRLSKSTVLVSKRAE